MTNVHSAQRHTIQTRAGQNVPGEKVQKGTAEGLSDVYEYIARNLRQPGENVGLDWCQLYRKLSTCKKQNY